MRTRALASALALCSTTLLWGCPQQDEDILATLTISKTGALVTANGRVLRAKEAREYAGHTLELVRIDRAKRLERLRNANGDVVRERQAQASDAQAQSQERSNGDDCTVFTDDSGDQVANTCAVPADQLGDTRCERLDTTGADGVALVCAVCYADNGDVVSRECHPVLPQDPCLDGSADCAPPQGCDPNNPNTDCMPPPVCDDRSDGNCLPPPVEQCRVAREADQTCRVCVTADGQTFTECWVDPDPARCEVLTTDDGLECVYCFDQNGEVVERSCRPVPCEPQPGACSMMPGGCQSDRDCPQGLACFDGTCCTFDATNTCPPPPPQRCEEFITDDGTFCRVCYDEAGNAIERFCETEPPPPVECREYREPNGRVCLICVDAAGNIARRECSDPPCPMADLNLACAAAADCPAGSTCENGICIWDCGPRECRLFQTANGYFCEICGDLNGDGVEDLSDAHCYPPPIDPIRCEEIASSTGERCVVCYDPAGQVVERRCEGNPEPPRCVVQQSDDATGVTDAACEICYDQAGNVVYNSCAQVQCWREEQVDPNGVFVVCEVCATDSGELSRFCHGTGCNPGDPNTDCPPPPQTCEQRVNSDGTVCVICYNDDGTVTQERCEGTTPPPSVCEERANSAGERCWVCYDAAGNVTEEGCQGGTEPIWCEDVATSSNELCTICHDGFGNVVSDSCRPPQQCWTETYVENGQQLTCEVCADAAGITRRTCVNTCSDATGCPQTLTAYIDPVQCGGNPWERNSSTDPNLDQNTQVRVWLESLGIPVFNIRFERVYDEVCEACTCPRGDRLFVETTAEGA
ncbi:MAG: hypothetical protein ABIJ09_08755, partial [Pseudomonadota bacterium]